MTSLLLQSYRVQKGKELNDFQRNVPDIEILSNLRFGSLEIRDTSVIVRYLRNLSVSLLEGNRTSYLREFSKFRDFSENRSVLFPSALATHNAGIVEVRTL